jgi:hypothetical protein
MNMSDVFTESGTEVPDFEAAPTENYRPLPTAEDLSERPKEKEYDGNDSAELRRAAKDLIEAREAGTVPQAEAEPVDRTYRWDGGTGKPVEDHYTLDAKRAAEDLTRVREIEAASLTQQQADVAAEVDTFRNAYAANQQQQQPEPQSDPQAQAPAAEAQQPEQPPPPGVDPEIAQALNNPKIRAALEAEVQSAEQARAAFAQGARQAAQVAAASVLANYPELANVPTAQLQTAIASIAQVNPQRAIEINAALGRTQALYAASVQAEQAQKQLHAQRIQEWTKAEEAKFEREVLSKESPATVEKLKQAMPQIIQEDYGISRDDLVHALQTNPALRSSAFQAVLLDALKFRTAQREVASKIARPVPPVQKPGVSQPRSNDGEVDAAIAKFRSDPNPKNAAALLIARRAANR